MGRWEQSHRVAYAGETHVSENDKPSSSVTQVTFCDVLARLRTFGHRTQCHKGNATLSPAQKNVGRTRISSNIRQAIGIFRRIIEELTFPCGLVLVRVIQLHDAPRGQTYKTARWRKIHAAGELEQFSQYVV